MHSIRWRGTLPSSEANNAVRVVRTGSAAETIELGTQIGALLCAGDVVLLTGDLGAGKTQLAQGVGRALGVQENVIS
ncbi:MAG: tRNA (adenosine(37)-N6)-threonylcarbamoyltransferase complex ATPase subunit type 1 TsaE, partial [Coriobacteriia bacterium]|nr:tRNA (adenosine(37)-N6)-threonylcarbamoyltransferase complex ATPase subunit type 1 TsaE [Coriobacteriia bacterium]